MDFAYGETAQWEQYTGQGEDDYGNTIDTWAAPVPVDGCGFDPGGSQEPRDGSSQRVVTTPVLYIPDSNTYSARDRFTIRGRLFEAEGDPADWRHPMTGWDPGLIVVNLQRVEG